MNHLIYRITLLFLMTLLIINSKAQPSEPGYPAAIRYNLPTSNLPVVNLPYFNNEELIAADTCANCGEGYGVDANVSFDFWEQSNLEVIENEFERVEIYRVRIISPTAKALHVVFSHFALGANSLMFIYSPHDSTSILGAFSMHNNKQDLSFISNGIDDKEMIIEINKRAVHPAESPDFLEINRFIHVYKDRRGFGLSLDCHENAICAPLYNEWCNQIRSVVKLVRYQFEPNVFPNTWRSCSGVLINNIGFNFDPLILTAHHCTENGADFPVWFAYLNYQSITCNPSTNGNHLMFISGMDVVTEDHDNIGCPDIALLRLRENIPLQYNVFFSGWNRNAWGSLPADRIGTGIHHPAGDVKKISEGDISNPLLSSCVRANWSTGYTEGGSSGSPLFVSSRQIIGVLSWSWHEEDDCDDDANFFYSWLNKSWSALQPHLAPGIGEVFTLDGVDPISVCQPVIDLNRRFFPGNDWQIKNQITIQAAQQINVANITETSIEQSPFNMPAFNSDYIVRAGNKITINPGFRINAPTHSAITGVYTTFYDIGNQNRVSFQIAPCTSFIDDCGFNHENAMVAPVNKEHANDIERRQPLNRLGFNFNIYPNPTNGSLKINLTSEDNLSNIHIVDVFGKIVYSNESIENENKSIVISLSGLSAGIYFITVGDHNDQFKTKKFVIN